MKRLHPDFSVVPNKCGVCDFQIWNKTAWDKIIKKVEEGKSSPKFFWKVFLDEVRETQGASEYEIYFHNYVNSYPHEFMTELKTTMTNRVSDLSKFKSEGYHAVSFHSWQGPRI
jgi:hypothetical protein